MGTTVNNRSFNELHLSLVEAENLSCLEHPTSQQRNRISVLLAKISALKSGVSPGEARAWEEERLRVEANLPPGVSLRGNPENNKLWRDFLKTGKSRGCALPPEFRDNLAGSQSLVYGSGSTGGYLVPFGYHEELAQSLTQYDEILSPEYSNQFDTETGQPFVSPAIDDIAGSPLAMNRSVIVAEAGRSNQSDVVAQGVQFPTAPTFRSGRMFVSIELIEDSPILATVLQAAIARRHSLGIGGYFITGAGTSTQPQGLTNNLPLSTITTSASSTLALADFENVLASLDASYFKSSVWYMSLSTRTLVTKLLETSGRSMNGPVNELLRRPIAICNSMNVVTPGASAVAVLASKDYIYQRFVPKASTIKQYNQASGYIDRGMIGVEGFMRADQRMMLFNSAIPPVASLNVHS